MYHRNTNILILHNVLSGVWAIEPGYAQQFMPLIISLLKGTAFPVIASGSEAISAPSTETDTPLSYDSESKHPAYHPEALVIPSSAAKRVVNGSSYRFDPRNYDDDIIVQMSITGAITKYDQACGPDGMTRQANRLRTCYNAKNVVGIILNIDSGGGEGNASRLMEETIRQRPESIPVVAFCNDFACSAAYQIASAADYIVANSATARIGSIGTYLTIVDYSKQLEAEGIRLIEIYAAASKDKNQDYYQALSGNLAPLQAVVNRYNDAFLESIRTNRPAAVAKETSWNSGKVFFADEALSIGLIDAIDNFDSVTQYFT